MQDPGREPKPQRPPGSNAEKKGALGGGRDGTWLNQTQHRKESSVSVPRTVMRSSRKKLSV